MQAQRTALTRWDQGEDAAYLRMRELRHLVVVAGGSHDLIIPTVNAIRLAQRLPNAQLILYPDSGYGFLFQLYLSRSAEPGCHKAVHRFVVDMQHQGGTPCYK